MSDRSSSKIPIRYVLYSHYSFSEKDDFDKWLKNQCPVDTLSGPAYLLSHARGLRELLTAPGHEGLLVIFYALGYERFLTDLAQKDNKPRSPFNSRTDEEKELNGRRQLDLAKLFSTFLQDKISQIEPTLANRIRIITFHDLYTIFGRVNPTLAVKFQKFFVGLEAGIRYDAPKLVESIVRLRLLGNGVPVLRVDQDVIFRGEENIDRGDLGLFKAVACSSRAYQLRLSEPTVSTFLFSSSYNTRALLNILRSEQNTLGAKEKEERFNAWGRAFATRIHPALIADPTVIIELTKLHGKAADEAWKDYAYGKSFDTDLLRQFFGLKPINDTLECDGASGITEFGAHPLFSVISGALLCMSDGAILDLPPFSNLRSNVMWIDDHIKYSLHRAMNHLTAGDTLDIERGLADARMDEVTVTKSRPSISNLTTYVFGTYLPTLLWGTIFDSWIVLDPISKIRLRALRSEDEIARWHEARNRQNLALLPSAILEAQRDGEANLTLQQNLARSLETRAIERINQVRKSWFRLKIGDRRTFASFWASGEVENFFPDTLFSSISDKVGDLWKGIAPRTPIEKEITRIDQLSATMAIHLGFLINDTVDYVQWSIDWPKFVQVVRSTPQGEFVGDLGWRPRQ